MKGPRALAVLALGAPLLLAGSAAGEGLDPLWTEAGDAPLPYGRSLAPRSDDTPVFQRPGAKDARRGTVVTGARLPAFSALRAPGCASRWLEVGPYAWVCGEDVDVSQDPPDTRPAYPVPGRDGRPDDGLPYRYFFAGPGGAYGYRNLARAGEDSPDASLEKGWSVAVVDEKSRGGEVFVRTTKGLWFAKNELNGARPFPFVGKELAKGATLPPRPERPKKGETAPRFPGGVGWVIVDRATVREAPRATAKGVAIRARFALVELTDVAFDGGAVFYAVSGPDGGWIRSGELAVPTDAPRPSEVGPEERWIDVELASQTLVAREGDRPVFATIVSTGRGAQGTETATPKGTFRIWAKLFTTAMDNLEREDAAHYYSIEDVPWVQFFHKGVALHGAFWHRNFGHVQSHGCVNLAPRDAERLFTWTTPTLPGGFIASLPYAADRGTVVRVR